MNQPRPERRVPLEPVNELYRRSCKARHVGIEKHVFLVRIPGRLRGAFARMRNDTLMTVSSSAWFFLESWSFFLPMRRTIHGRAAVAIVTGQKSARNSVGP